MATNFTSRAAAGLLALAPLAVMAAPQPAGLPVIVAPEDGYAQLNLPSPFLKIVFPPKTELDGKVVSLNGGKTLLIKFMANSIKKTLIGYISLQDGTLLRVGFRQAKGATPPVWTAPGVADNIPQRQTPAAVSWIVKVMRSTVMDGKPAGMTATNLPSPENVGALQIKPLAAWSGGGYRLLEYKLESKSLLSVSPRDFYRKGVVAVLTQTDTVSASQSPALLILEKDVSQ